MADIVARVRKLIELSKHNNSAEEAARAAALAQDLMFKYQIGEADLDTEAKREPEELTEESITEGNKGRKKQVWRACLAYAIAKGFGCEMYNTRNKDGVASFQVYGLKSATQTVSYMYGYLQLEISRLCDEAWRAAKLHPRHARTWKNSFRMGAVNAIRERLEAQRKEQVVQVREAVKQQPTSTALALYKTDQERVEEGWGKREKELKLRAARAVRYRKSADAYDQGVEAGENVALGGGRGLGAKKTQIEA